MARTERTLLCDLALEVGPDQPTLSGEWTVRQLVAHLVLRESSPEALGAVVPALRSVTDKALARLTAKDFAGLVERLRNGPPRYSPFAVPKIDAIANTVEFFVHHEDIRRAQPVWEPRVLSDRHTDVLWKLGPRAGKAAARKAGVGVVAERSDTGATTLVKWGPGPVTVRGLPGEITLFLFGRTAQARVELGGSAEHIARLSGAPLGL